MHIDPRLQHVAELYLNTAEPRALLAPSKQRGGRRRSKIASNPDVVVTMYQAGQTLESVAKFFGTSIRTVTHVLKEAGVERRGAGRKSMEHLTHDVVAFHKSGASLQEIGDKFGIAQSTASKLLSNANIDAEEVARQRSAARSRKIA